MPTENMTERLGLSLLFAGQAQKEMTHNEALQRLDMLVQPVVVAAGLHTPPSSPIAGDCWIVGAEPSGEWADQEDRIAQWTAGGWRFAMPARGWRVHVETTGGAMSYDGAQWVVDAVRPDGLYVDGLQVTGARKGAIPNPTGGGTIDVEARSRITAILAALRGHGLITE